MSTRSGTKYGAPPNLTILRQNVDKSQRQLMDSVIIDLGEMPIDEITAHIAQVKQFKSKFVTNSQCLSTTLLETEIESDSQEGLSIRRERHEILAEVKEYIDIANRLLSQNQFDTLSNIEVYSHISGAVSNHSQADGSEYHQNQIDGDLSNLDLAYGRFSWYFPEKVFTHS